MSNDPETTDTNWKSRYFRAEAKADEIISAGIKSPVTLVLFIGWTLLAVVFGLWLRS